MRYVKLYIKTFLCCYLFASIDTVGMDRRIDLLELLEFAIGVLFIFFPPVLIISNIFFNKEKHYINLGKTNTKSYMENKEKVKDYNPFVLAYSYNNGISMDKGLFLEIFYLLFNGYLKIENEKIVITGKDIGLKEYQKYIIEKIDKNETIVFKELKSIFLLEYKDVIEKESSSNLVKGIIKIISGPLIVVGCTLLFRVVPFGVTALMSLGSFVVAINYLVDGFFLLFEKNIVYTDYGNKELKKINSFIDYMKSHSPFIKEDNVILYYDYLLYSYALNEKLPLLKDRDMKIIRDIVKKYIYTN